MRRGIKIANEGMQKPSRLLCDKDAVNYECKGMMLDDMETMQGLQEADGTNSDLSDSWGEKEKPLECWFNNDFNFDFNFLTFDNLLLHLFLLPGRTLHDWIGLNVVVGPGACWKYD